MARRAALVVRRLRNQPWLRRGVQLLIIVVPLAYVVYRLIVNWESLRDFQWHLDPWRLLGALISLLLARMVSAIAGQRALSGLGYHMDSRSFLRGYFTSQLSIYLPGGLYVGRAIVFGGYGVDVISSSAALMIELNAYILSGMLGSVPYLVLTGTAALPYPWLWGVILAPLLLSFLHPAILGRVLRWLLARAGYQDRQINLTVRQLITVLLLHVAYWLLAGAGFYLLVSSVHSVSSALFPVLVSAFCLAETATMLLSVTPGGLGVLEGLLTLVLAPLLPAPLPALMAVLTRLWSTAALLIVASSGALLGKSPQQAVVDEGPLLEDQGVGVESPYNGRG